MPVIALGVILSLLWCWAGWYYLEQAIGFENLMLFLPHEIGQFAIGFFTPLFLLWILIVLVILVRRLGRLSASPASPGGGGRTRDPQFDDPAAAPPKHDSKKTEKRQASAPGRAEPSGKETEHAPPKPSGRAAASASVSTTEESGKVTLKKVEESTVAGDGPVTAVARAVGRKVEGAPPPQRPEEGAGGVLPPKRPESAKQAESSAAAETETTPPHSPPGPLPPKRPSEENVAPLPRSADGPRPPKSPKTIVENYAEAQGHTVKELNAIAMDTAVLICDQDAYRASREALNDGRGDSFFELVGATLEQDGGAAIGKLQLGGNGELLDAYCNKFRSLLQAAAQEPEADSLVSHLENSAPGRLYATIESKL